MAHETRKTVTILFADITGSTGLGEQLDPETLRRVMARYFEEARAAIERHGGTVEKFIGDAVMAVFGIPLAHEDDALRAVRAAVEIRDALARLNDEFERERGVTLAVRTGVNTGEVVAGDPAHGQSFATGDAVNVAARLEQAAEPGEILLGEATYRLVRDAARANPVEALSVRGKTRAVFAWRLGEVQPSASGHTRRFDSQLVGRERELRALRTAFEHAVKDRCPLLVTLVGEAGVGKSRLASELIAQIAREARVLVGRCLSYGEGITYWPLVPMLEELERQIPIAALSGETGELLAQRIYSAVGRTDATATTEEIFWAVRKLFQSLASDRALVVVVDDVHWAEPTFLDLLEHVVDWTQDAPILVLCLARPEFLEERPGWPGERITLEPLSDVDAKSLIDNLAVGTSLTGARREQIKHAAEGNPLFVEQMIAMISDEGRGERLAVPPTIDALLTARLDRLPHDERAILERAAVVGKEFWREAVVALSPDNAEVSVLLQRLVRKGFVRPDGSALRGEDAFRFHHVLIRDAAYAATRKEVRAELHERFADWLEARSTDYDEIVGFHLEQAYRCRAELGPIDEHGRELCARARERLSAAGRRSLRRGDPSAASNLLERALALTPGDARVRFDLLLQVGVALGLSGMFARSDEILGEAVEAAQACGAPDLELHALLERCFVRGGTEPEGNTQEQERIAREAIRLFEAERDETGLARAWTALARVHHIRGQFGPRASAYERALTHARRAGDEQQSAEILQRLHVSLAVGPTPVSDAIRRCDEILQGEYENPLVHAAYLCLRGELESMRGAFEEARSLVSRGLATYEDIAPSSLMGIMTVAEITWFIEMQAGDPLAAERAIRRAYELLEPTGEKAWLSTQAAELADALYAQGRYDDAERFTFISEAAAASDDSTTQIMWRQVRAKVHARRGEFADGVRLARDAVALAEGTDMTNWRGNALFDLAEVLRLAGRSEESVEPLEQAITLFEAKENVVMAERARALLADLALLSPSQ